jgi:hypothetical protein
LKMSIKSISFSWADHSISTLIWSSVQSFGEKTEPRGGSAIGHNQG